MLDTAYAIRFLLVIFKKFSFTVYEALFNHVFSSWLASTSFTIPSRFLLFMFMPGQFLWLRLERVAGLLCPNVIAPLALCNYSHALHSIVYLCVVALACALLRVTHHSFTHMFCGL